MLDVHPPHEAAHTWKDFFIHIATIVIGLLIAVGLEQTVEYIHHRTIGTEAREQLLAERTIDEQANDLNIFTTLRHQADLHRDLAILHAVRTHRALPPGPFIVRRYRYLYANQVWRRLHESGDINYLRGNLYPITYRYDNQDFFTTHVAESTQALLQGTSMLQGQDDPPRVSPDSNIRDSNFLRAIVLSHETLPESDLLRGYAALAEHADLTQLTPDELDRLQRAIQVALADEDALLSYCYNIKRNLHNNPTS